MLEITHSFAVSPGKSRRSLPSCCHSAVRRRCSACRRDFSTSARLAAPNSRLKISISQVVGRWEKILGMEWNSRTEKGGGDFYAYLKSSCCPSSLF
ncbi:hypothetical protein AAHA92_21956 [Salvia divinorum]|uniref:Uncharacterized protein n=1 Tax=Salvia divinorum TaxID=28513 RepID=A0ABD1GQ30_SALDI